MSEPTLDPRLVIQLQGRAYPTYGAVLDLAHRIGLLSIETELVQIPGPDNEHTAIVKATVHLADPRMVFTDYGDASPRNVNSRIATALIRMASTRAKGRALRDAVNVGECLLEELPGDDQAEERPRYPPEKWGAAKAEVVNPRDCQKERADAALHEAATRGRERMAAGIQTGMTPIGATRGPVVCGVCKVPFTIEQIAHCDKHGLEYVHPKCVTVGEASS